ncbi:HD domain-containing protein [Patescibacteria group bacterium]|nr:HD domain-containing protein [Patescibacteria group bacterium]
MQQILDFFVRAEKLKATLRASWTSDSSRSESVADHSWMSCLLAMTLFEKISVPLDRERVLKMIILHDLAEAVTGDIPLIDQQGSFNHEEKSLNERKAMDHILEPLPESTKQEFLELWQECEERTTLEGKFAKAIDYLEACLQYWTMDMDKWVEQDFNIAAYYRDERYQFDAFLKEFKAFVNEKTMEKILASGREAFLAPELLEKYRKSQSTTIE